MLLGAVPHTSLTLEPEDFGEGFAGLARPGLIGHVCGCFTEMSRQLHSRHQ